MNNQNLYAFKKVVNKSMLTEGIPLTSPFREMVYEQLPASRERGSRIPIHILLNDIIYNITLYNQPFNEEDHPNHHSDLFRFNYTTGSAFAKELRRIFNSTYQRVLEHQVKEKHLVLPDDQKEYIVFYPTNHTNTFLAECVLTQDIQEERHIIQQFDESQVEDYINYYMKDSGSGIYNRLGNTKIRKYNRSIGETLKKIYSNKCQICSHDYTDRYWTPLSEIHHIDYYTKSLNNDSDNLLVICPNHHRIIHKINPIFRKESMSFLYPNGLVEEVKVYNILMTNELLTI